MFPTLSASFYIIGSTWPATAYSASSLTQLSHLQHSVSFMFKKKIIREGEKKGRRRPGFSVHQHQQSLWWNAGIIQLYSGFGKDLKRPRDLKTFHISGCPNPPLSTYHLLCLFTTNSRPDSKNSTHPPLTCFIVKKGLLERGSRGWLPALISGWASVSG